MNKVIALLVIVCLLSFTFVVGYELPKEIPDEPKIAQDEASPFHPHIGDLGWRGLLSPARYKVTVLTKHPETNGKVLYITLVQVGTPGSTTEYMRVYQKAFTTLRFPIKGKGYLFIPVHSIEGLKVELVSSVHGEKK